MGANTLSVNMPVVEGSDVVFVAVKPGVVPTVLNDVKSKASGKLFISVAMGFTIKQIETVSVCLVGCNKLLLLKKRINKSPVTMV